MGEDTGLPKIPCVYCNHPNPPGHRFCGMCGKALPDLVKQAPRPAAASPSISAPPAKPAPPVASGSPSTTAASRTPLSATRHENPNRDLSYLLHDDHQPAPANRMPFIIGGLVLAAVAAFFVMRGGGKPAATSTTAGEAGSTQSADPATAPGATVPAETAASEPTARPPKAEPKAEPKVEPKPDREAEVAKSAPRAAPPVAKPAHHPAPAARAHAPKPSPPATTLARKPSPSHQEAAPADDTTASSVPDAVNQDCDKRLPALRKAAAAGSAKARADLGLVYYAGRCVPRDLPTSYHYYALALRTAPDSPMVSAQLEAIWKQMSPAERQLALKAQ